MGRVFEEEENTTLEESKNFENNILTNNITPSVDEKMSLEEHVEMTADSVNEEVKSSRVSEEEENTTLEESENFENDILTNDIIPSVDEKMSIEQRVNILAKNRESVEKKLLDSVSKMKQQREDEMRKIKASKAADSSIINASNYGEKDNTQELDNDTSKKNKKPKKKNSLLFLAKNDEKKLMDSVSKIKREREEEFKKMNAMKADSTESEDRNFEILNQKNDKKLMDSVSKIKREREEELKKMKALKAASTESEETNVEILNQKNDKKLRDSVSKIKKERE